MKKQNKKEKLEKTKKLICAQLEGKRKFRITWMEEVCYFADVEAESKDDAENKFFEGQTDAEVESGEFIEGSLEIEEDI